MTFMKDTNDSSGQTKIKCNLCGKEFECGYAAQMHVINDDCKEWWELLIWEDMTLTWARLPEEIKNKIRERGEAPSWDDYDSSSTTKKEGNK